jgi:hypothetical protein
MGKGMKSNQVCKFVPTMVIGGLLGSYFGECTKVGGAGGVGVFIVGNKEVFIGQFEKDNLAFDIPYIRIDRIQKTFGVYFLNRPRPNAQVFQVGRQFRINGKITEGLFKNYKLVMAQPVKITCMDPFMAFGTKLAPGGNVGYSENL